MDPNHMLFVVEHLHVLNDGEESIKLIGVYSTRENAEKAVERLKVQPGFRDAIEGFTIDPYLLDEDNWAEGYITLKYMTEDNSGNSDTGNAE